MIIEPSNTGNYFRIYTLYFLLGFLFAACGELQKNIKNISSQVEKQEAYDPIGSVEPDGYYEIIPKMSKKGYEVKKLADGVYFFTTGIYNNLFVVTPQGLLITDPIGGKGLLLKKAISEITDLPIKFMVYTHSHIDHIGDAALFADGVQIIAHKETANILRRYNDPNRPSPHIAFDRRYTLNFGGKRIELIFVAKGHDYGNIMVYLPKSKILMIVDVATPKAVPFKNFSTVDIYGQIIGIQHALKLDWNTYVAGHFYRPGKRSEMKEILEYYYASKSANAEALKRVTFQNVIKKTKSKDMERIFGEYYELVSKECYKLLKKTWKRRLMGFEAFARGHCDTWTAFHRTHKRP